VRGRSRDEVKVEDPHINEGYESEGCMVENKLYIKKGLLNCEN
jgi:hypothetical protein